MPGALTAPFQSLVQQWAGASSGCLEAPGPFLRPTVAPPLCSLPSGMTCSFDSHPQSVIPPPPSDLWNGLCVQLFLLWDCLSLRQVPPSTPTPAPSPPSTQLQAGHKSRCLLLLYWMINWGSRWGASMSFELGNLPMGFVLSPQRAPKGRQDRSKRPWPLLFIVWSGE